MTKVFNDVVVAFPQVTISGKYIESVFDDFVDQLPEIRLDDRRTDTVDFDDALTLIDKDVFANRVKTLIEADIKEKFNKRNVHDTLADLNIYTESIATVIVEKMKNIENTPAFKEIVKRKNDDFAAYQKKHAAEEIRALRVQAAALGYRLIEDK